MYFNQEIQGSEKAQRGAQRVLATFNNRQVDNKTVQQQRIMLGKSDDDDDADDNEIDGVAAAAAVASEEANKSKVRNSDAKTTTTNNMANAGQIPAKCTHSTLPQHALHLYAPTTYWLFLVLLLVCGCCSNCRCSAYAMEYSAKVSNCDDMQHGFNGGGLRGGMVTSITMSTQQQQQQNFQQQQSLQNSFNGTQPTQLASSAASLTTLPTMTGWKCCCWNATNQDEVECRCEGEALTRVPQTLTVSLQRLTIASAGLPRLRNTGLNVYSATLMDVVLTDLKQLECIQDGAFASLRLLRTIYISHAPKLTYLSKDVFKGMSDTIKIIRIINSGLTSVPDLFHLPPGNILQMIDLDNNHITRIDKKSINVKTEQLILANNDIRYIDESAFFGSQIAKLSLKENRKLKEVHPNAFIDMNMQELDLSSTSLIRLPSAGLQDIEELRIENTQTLKTIPSIYNFKNLQRAYLTHSFHCCAFKFPSRHDPLRHAQRMKEIEKWQQQCKKPTQHQHHDTTSITVNGAIIVGAGSSSIGNGGSSVDAGESTATVAGVTAAMHAAINTLQQTAAAGGIFFSRQQRRDVSVQQGLWNDSQGSSSGSGSGSGGDLGMDMGSFADVAADAVGSGNQLEHPLDYSSSDDDYMSDSMLGEIGIFHEKIEINPQSQLEEYCGNFTIRKHEVECYPMPNALNPCEDVMGYQWLRISVWIVVALAVVGNVAVLVVILSIRSDTSSVPRFLMCHLAFADLCLGLYLLLIASIDAHSMGEYFNYAYDWQYGAGCKVAGFLTVFASHLSVFTLTVITIERWLAITHALFLNKRIKLRPAAFIMIAGWIFSICMSSLPLFGISNYSSTSICLPMEDRDPFDTVYLVLIMGLNGAAFCIIAVCYAQIYLSLGKETRHAKGTNSGEMGVAKKMALLVFTNFACWAPIAFFGLTALAGYPLINVTKSKILLVFFYPLNSCADPYLYAILTSQYRQDLYTLLSKFGLCKASALKYRNSLSVPATTNYTIHGSIQRHSSLNAKQLPGILSETQLMLKNQEDFV